MIFILYRFFCKSFFGSGVVFISVWYWNWNFGDKFLNLFVNVLINIGYMNMLFFLYGEI